MDTSTNLGFAVIDASVVLAELLPDEKNSPKVEQYFIDFSENKLSFMAPSILKYEVTNSFRSQFLQKRLSAEKTSKILEKFLSLPIIYKEVSLKHVLTLAIKENLTVYDASYLYLAKTNKCSLLTLDKKLASL